ncbi:hypothetical protein MKEN_01358600 [Mycena kentingensis (nom. inval.)]|nr:hypothetical protein MKEN_01358600 [Mycena kentingensis (nom. inval.)]
MFLVQSTPSTSNTTYTDEAGVPRYSVNTSPYAYGTPTTTGIHRITQPDPSASPRSALDLFAVDADLDLEPASPPSAELARIRWNILQSSIIDFAGRERKARSWLRRANSLRANTKVVFTAQDGREYRWTRRDAAEMELRTNDASDALVARFRTKTHVPTVSPTRPLAALEILPQFEDMADEILVTFVYCENRRRRSSPTRRDSN